MKRESGDDRLSLFLRRFLSAGSSALLLATAHLHTNAWPLALFAFVPFLRRVMRESTQGAALTGILLATSYCLTVHTVKLQLAADQFLYSFLLLNAIVATYALAARFLRARIGFNVIFIAALWLPMEFAITQSSVQGPTFLTPSIEGDAILLRIGMLTGTLGACFVVLVINSLLLAILDSLTSLDLASRAWIVMARPIAAEPIDHVVVIDEWYQFPDVKDPPVATVRF